MRKSQRNRISINDTIENWNKISFTNPILNLIWDLLPGFTLWQIWKERNKRIFHSQSSPVDATWTKVKAQVTETVRNKSWTEKDWQCNPEEKIILHNWQLDLTNHLLSRSPTVPLVSPTTWTTPPAHFIKVNFDGASKGNPGPVGYGTVLRNSDGEILGLEAGFIGDTTNNVGELTGLVRRLQAATNKGYQRILLEGDSQPIIKLATRIIHGCDPEKISPSWRLSGLLVDFSHHLHPHLTITTSHVKREANKVADQLANEAVETGEERLSWDGQSSPTPEILTHCQALARKDLHSPDGVIGGAIVPGGKERGRCVNSPVGPSQTSH
jgi:ribonuclease HI